MKKYPLLIGCFLMIASAAMADHIGVYKDQAGVTCNLGNIAGQFSSTATVIHQYTVGATGSRFKVTFPAGTAFLGFNTPYVTIGALNTDLSIAYGQCVFGGIVLGTINAIYGAGTGKVEKADLQPMILYTDCLFAELSATGGIFLVNGASDPCIIAVEQSTWGKVKSLYRD